MCVTDVSSLAVCPFCGGLVGVDAVQCGTFRLHPACYEEMGIELGEQEQEI